MASTDRELEQQLLEAGNRLVDPPPAVDELIALLDQVENCLSRVEQSPSRAMQDALAPSLKALVADQLFKHLNVDVRVAVASCISEITRITAPDAPYDDEQMKDVFQLIVSCFENLADRSSPSYGKRTAVLETVAKVRSCVVMLDLECDALIIEMFQHFLNAVRDYHPENVITAMETIMTLVLEESEDISPELLSPLLASVKRGNEEVLPVARRLGERVLESCAAKVKPYLQQAVNSLGASLDEYSDIVASICQEISGTVEQSDAHAADENKVEETKPAGASSDDADKAIATDAGSSKQADRTNDKSPKSVVSNGVAQTGEDDSLADSCSLKKQEDGNQVDHSKSIDMSSNANTDVLDSEKIVNEETGPEQATKKKGKKVNSSTKLTEASESSQSGADKEAHKLPDDQTHSKDVPSCPQEEPSVEATVSSENKKEAVSSQPPSPKAQEGESMNVASPSASGSIPDENLSKNSGRTKKKETLIKDSEPSADDVPKKTSEGTSDSEAKPNKRSARKAPAKISNEEKAPLTTDATKKETGTTSESEAKPLKQSSKKVATSGNNGDGSSLNQSEDKKQRSRGKSISDKSMSKNSTKADDKEKVFSPKSATKSTKDEHQLEDTPKTDKKRKRGSSNEKGSDNDDSNAALVGLRVKVWWPKDRQFYEGEISGYDPVRKKHKVTYDDGDVETLTLKKEKWQVIKDDSAQDEGEAADRQSLEVPSEMPLKKKVKTNSDQSSKQGKVDASPLRGGGASSSKSKNAATKSGRKSKEVSKTDGKSVDESKAAKKAEDDSVGKTKDNSSRSGSKIVDVTPKTSSKSKNDESASKTGKSKEDGMRTPKTSSKSKQETVKTGKSKQDTPKATSNAKGKSPKSGGKSSVNGTGKLKSGFLKVKETEEKEESTDSGKLQESIKRKSKGQGSEVKSGKKRRRV
ncbi:hypothetical protein JCGZ_07095 [Jatropha curcas]|uniref:Tudor domain-containing protein n=1 Tax=Jatropha curcas TaxID=180498 RepID=A0A067KNY9_JATCU|nr:titin homolog [Jatropha curcas]KDP33524.1 hypothetical protein JCGZ_07095 [Jatropha curcas]